MPAPAKQLYLVVARSRNDRLHAGGQVATKQSPRAPAYFVGAQQLSLPKAQTPHCRAIPALNGEGGDCFG